MGNARARLALSLFKITEKGETRLFMIIADKTSGKETYPAGRYLYVDPPDAAGRMVIDFNKAYSPGMTRIRLGRLPAGFVKSCKFYRRLLADVLRRDT